MKPDEVMRLLGGYATGTLSEQERKALFEAALEKQELFDALADDEALRELLADAGFRQRLIGALEARKPAFGERLAGWLRRPVPVALAGTVAVAVVAVVTVTRTSGPTTALREIAVMKQSAPMPEAAAPEPEIAPAPAPAAVPPVEKKTPQRLQLSELREEMAEPGAAEGKGKVVMMASKEAEPAAAPAAAPRLVYHLERRGENGTYARVEAAEAFHAGDEIRLVAEPLEGGYLQAYLVRPEAPQRLLYGGQVEAQQRYPIPATGFLPSDPGEIQVRLLFSRQFTGRPVSPVRARVAERREEADELAESPAVIQVRLSFR